MTECNEKQLEFHALGKRAVIGKCDGGAISSDGGAVLLSEVEAKTRIVDRLAGLFVDHRKPYLIEHSVRELIWQRVFGLVLAETVPAEGADGRQLAIPVYTIRFMRYWRLMQDRFAACCLKNSPHHIPRHRRAALLSQKMALRIRSPHTVSDPG